MRTDTMTLTGKYLVAAAVIKFLNAEAQAPHADGAMTADKREGLKGALRRALL